MIYATNKNAHNLRAARWKLVATQVSIEYMIGDHAYAYVVSKSRDEHASQISYCIGFG
jgi:hypothetical protein